MTDTMLLELPENWEWTTIGEVTRVNFRDPRLRDLDEKMPVTFVPMAAIDEVRGEITAPQLREIGQVKRGYTPFGEGDVLFAKITPCMENGKAAIARNLCNKIGFGSTEFHVMRPSPHVLSEWLFYYVRRTLFRDEAKANFSGTAGQLRVKKGFIVDAPIPLPTISEQRRILDEIEKQFTRLDAAVAALERVQANLARYKASVLKAACEGRLVEQDEGDESAEILLARISAERRRRWEADHPGKRYVEPVGVDSAVLPALPSSWVWATPDHVSARIVDCLHSTARFQDIGYMCVDTNCIRPGRIILDKVRFVDEETFHERNRRMVPRANDVLFSREGALLGIAVAVPEDLQFCLGQRMMVFRLAPGVSAKYFESVLNSNVFRNQYKSEITGTASPHLNIRDIRRFGVPLPPLAEQLRIVAEVERRLSVVAAVESVVATNLARAARLRQSILQRAFTGRLLPAG